MATADEAETTGGKLLAFEGGKHGHIQEAMKLLSWVLGVVVVLGGFAAFLLAQADARAAKAETSAASEAASAKADVAQLRKDVSGELEAAREDIRGVYRYLLTQQRQPRLEAPVATEGPP